MYTCQLVATLYLIQCSYQLTLKPEKVIHVHLHTFVVLTTIKWKLLEYYYYNYGIFYGDIVFVIYLIGCNDSCIGVRTCRGDCVEHKPSHSFLHCNTITFCCGQDYVHVVTYNLLWL